MNDSIAIQKRKLVEEALNFGLKLKAIDEDFDAPGVKSKKMEKRLSMQKPMTSQKNKIFDRFQQNLPASTNNTTKEDNNPYENGQSYNSK